MGAMGVVLLAAAVFGLLVCVRYVFLAYLLKDWVLALIAAAALVVFVIATLMVTDEDGERVICLLDACESEEAKGAWTLICVPPATSGGELGRGRGWAAFWTHPMEGGRRE
jgi:hypothetical protein